MKPQLTDKEILDMADKNEYVIQFRSVYAPHFSKNCGGSLQKIHYHKGDLPLTKRGRFFIISAEELNCLQLRLKLI